MLLKHPNIISMYGFYEDEKYFYLLTEYAPEGEISKTLRKNSIHGEVNIFSE